MIHFVHKVARGWGGVSDLILKLADKLQLPFQLSKKQEPIILFIF